jgi:hypothetical protein
MSQSKFKAANLLAGTALVALGVAVAGPASADGHAKVIKSGQDKVSLKISGQFSREIHLIDDGVNERVHHQDSNYSSSRFRMHADGKVNASLKVSGLLEVAFDDARNTVDNLAPPGARSGNDFQTRKAEIMFKHSQFGKVSMGAGDTAANSVMHANAHGIYAAIPTGLGLITTTTQFTNSGDSTQSGVTNFAGALPDLDFNSRNARLRYDTPVFAGFMGSISHSSNQAVEYALRYGGKIFGTKISAALGMAQNTSGQADNENYGGTISGVHSSGLGATFSCGFQNGDESISQADDAGCTAQGHFQRKFNEMGKTSLVVEFQQADDVNAQGDIAQGFGVTLHQAIDASALEVWAKYSNFDLERDGSDFNDIDIISVGTRIKF